MLFDRRWRCGAATGRSRLCWRRWPLCGKVSAGLFLTVCQAIQHAHQKGIIHRGLKPSSILVTLHDGVPVAKVIDFGIAKALGQQLTDKTVFTHFAQMVGTPLYMSWRGRGLAVRRSIIACERQVSGSTVYVASAPVAGPGYA
jgi:serine/threonine protein kinase